MVCMMFCFNNTEKFISQD